MSQLKVDNITNEAGTGATDFPNGASVAGNNLPTGGPLAGFRNAIINGNFDHWQRGTSGTAGYVSDRWATIRGGSTVAISRQAFALGQTDVPNEPEYFHRSVVSSVAGAGNFANLAQRVEGVRTFAGQTVTVSFYAKADAAKNMALELFQTFGTGGSPSSEVNAIGVTTLALTTTFQKFTVTADIPSIAGKTVGTNGNDDVGINFWFDAGSNFDARTNSLGHQSGTFDIAQVQLEAGSVATPFERRPVGTELALCQRYYSRPPGFIGVIYNSVTNSEWATNLAFPVEMRATPTMSRLSASVTPGSSNPVADSVTISNCRVVFTAGNVGANQAAFQFEADSEL